MRVSCLAGELRMVLAVPYPRVDRPALPRMWWHSRRIPISTVLIGESIALEPIDDGEWDLHFGPMRLGRFDERTRRIQPAARRQR